MSSLIQDPRAGMQNPAVGSAASLQRWDQVVALVLCTPGKRDVSIAFVVGSY